MNEDSVSKETPARCAARHPKKVNVSVSITTIRLALFAVFFAVFVTGVFLGDWKDSLGVFLLLWLWVICDGAMERMSYSDED